MAEFGFLMQILGLLLCSLAILTIIGEILLRGYAGFKTRFLVSEIRRQDYLDPAYHPYINWTDRWDKAMFRYIPIATRVFNLSNPIPPVTNNSMGFRTVELSEVETDAVRVAVLGGSAAWGFGASSNATTIAGHIERLLNASKVFGTRKVQVFNLAQVNQTQTQDLVTGLFLFPRIQPHIVVALNGWNELAAGITMDGDLMSQWRAFPLMELVNWEPMQAGDNALRNGRDALLYWASRHLHLVRRIAPRFMTSKPPLFKRTIAEQVKLATPIFLSHMEQMQTLARGFGFRYFQFCQPNLYRKKYPVDWEAKALDLYDNHRPMMAGKESGDFLRANDIYGEIEVVAAQDPVRYGHLINLGDIFREARCRSFHSLVHCTDAGYEEIANEICSTIINSGLEIKQ